MPAPRISMLLFAISLLATRLWASEFDYIVAQRLAAHDRLMAGELWQGAEDLLKSLRELPEDKPDVADVALGSMQLMLFTVQYLMDDATWRRFEEKVLDPKRYPLMDTFACSF